MRKLNQTARDQLVPLLGRMPRASAPVLAAALRVSVPFLHKMLAELPASQVVFAGRTRRTRYALRRPLRGDLSEIPLYRIDAAGNATLVSKLALIYPQGALLALAESGWPIPPESRDGWWEGLPYPIYDIRPQGYLGRQIARAEQRQLGVSINPEEWSDDDVVFVLSRVGTDASGNLLLGDEAYRRWLQNKLSPMEPVPEAMLGEQYSRLAQQALAAGVAGSSVAGEFPKFTALRQDGQATPHVLVKFSGASQSAAEQRWADLLICENLALECAAGLPGVTSARTRVIQHAGRVFLETERFDRVDLHGRLAVCTLDALNPAFLGDKSTDWTHLMRRLEAIGLAARDAVRAVDHLSWFGRLVGNTDMHLGHLSFHVSSSTLRLAPTYDMLPMAYAPLSGGEVPPYDFNPPLPLPQQRDVWQLACASAIAFWQHASTDVRVSASFRTVCAANMRRLSEIAPRV
jgi:hypothetical protein